MASGDDYLSVVVPLYNEADYLVEFDERLSGALEKSDIKDYEIIYVDDGSLDETAAIVTGLCKKDNRKKLLKLSRNFGKESALSAGIAATGGEAIIMIDGDGQHPPDLIPSFVKHWQDGAKVVVGVRAHNKHEGRFKRSGSKMFYKLFNKISDEKLVPRSTDFRLIDRQVADAFLQLKENDRITRALIDWLGFKKVYIDFEANARSGGKPGYSQRKLVKLAANTFVSMSPVPLYFFGYIGVFITSGAFLLGTAVFIEQIIFNDPLHWKFTGTAMLSILILFLVGILLLAQGILSLYVSHIHSQSKSRPLYIVDDGGSYGIGKIKKT